VKCVYDGFLLQEGIDAVLSTAGASSSSGLACNFMVAEVD
jgi:hypothetical protein